MRGNTDVVSKKKHCDGASMRIVLIYPSTHLATKKLYFEKVEENSNEIKWKIVQFLFLLLFSFSSSNEMMNSLA